MFSLVLGPIRHIDYTLKFQPNGLTVLSKEVEGGGLMDSASPGHGVGCVHWRCPLQQVVRHLFNKSVYPFFSFHLSRWPVDSSPYSTISGRQLSPTFKMCLLSAAVFEEQGLDAGNV